MQNVYESPFLHLHKSTKPNRNMNIHKSKQVE